MKLAEITKAYIQTINATALWDLLPGKVWSGTVPSAVPRPYAHISVKDVGTEFVSGSWKIGKYRITIRVIGNEDMAEADLIGETASLIFDNNNAHGIFFPDTKVLQLVPEIEELTLPLEAPNGQDCVLYNSTWTLWTREPQVRITL